jgi:hypothetical protein
MRLELIKGSDSRPGPLGAEIRQAVAAYYSSSCRRIRRAAIRQPAFYNAKHVSFCSMGVLLRPRGLRDVLPASGACATCCSMPLNVRGNEPFWALPGPLGRTALPVQIWTFRRKSTFTRHLTGLADKSTRQGSSDRPSRVSGVTETRRLTSYLYSTWAIGCEGRVISALFRSEAEIYEHGIGVKAGTRVNPWCPVLLSPLQ